MSTIAETITRLHRMGAVLDDVRRLLVGDLDRPAYVAVPGARIKWLNGVHLAAEVAAYAPNPEHQQGAVYSLRNQLRAEPKAAAL